MKLNARARFASNAVYSTVQIALQVIEARQEKLDNFYKAMAADFTENAPKSRLGKMLNGPVPKTLKEILLVMDPSKEVVGADIPFRDAWHQYKHFHNDLVETYNELASIMISISEGHAQEIEMDAARFAELRDLIKQNPSDEE